MACFIVPAAEAAVVTAITKAAERKNNSSDTLALSKHSTFISRLKQLEIMLWGGSALLAFEHLWHGELVPWFPFLTNAVNAADRMEMLREMATVGTSMATLVTLVWAAVTAASIAFEKQVSERGTKGEII